MKRLHHPGQAVTTLRFFLLAIILAGCSDSSTNPSSHVATGDLQVSEAAEAIVALDLRAINGTMMLASSDTEEISADVRVEVEADRRSEAAAFLEEVDIQVVRRDDGLLLQETYPEPPRGVTVETFWTVSLPEDTSIDLELVNGTLVFDGQALAVAMQATNGNLTVRGTAGPLALSCTNGSITTSLDELIGDLTATNTNGSNVHAMQAGTGSVSSSLVNGTIRVVLPEGYDGVLDARTSNGTVSCTIPLTDTDVRDENEIRGTLGSGGAEVVALGTVNGNISIDETES